MKPLLSLFMFLMISPAIHAQRLSVDNDQYDTCVIEHQREVKNSKASKLMIMACEKLYKEGIYFASPEERYNNCLLQNLQRAENDEATQQIVNACERQSKNMFPK